MNARPSTAGHVPAAPPRHRCHPVAAWLAAAVAVALAGCTTMPSGNAQSAAPTPAGALAKVSTVQQATVTLAPASASLVSGRLLLRPMGNGVHLTGEIGGLPRNSTHAIHIHETGDCSAADASSAGGHFDPTGAPHGRASTGAHHAGDMDNIVANAAGVARVDAHASGVVLGAGARNDALGRAVVVHARRDDYTTQPAGDAGARVACGVIRAGG